MINASIAKLNQFFHSALYFANVRQVQPDSFSKQFKDINDLTEPPQEQRCRLQLSGASQSKRKR